MGRLNAPQSSSVKRENELCYGLTPFLKLELLIRVLAAPGYSNCARHARKVPNLKFLIKLLKSNLRFDPFQRSLRLGQKLAQRRKAAKRAKQSEKDEERSDLKFCRQGSEESWMIGSLDSLAFGLKKRQSTGRSP